MPRDAAKPMRPELMWAIVKPDGRMLTFPLWQRDVLRRIDSIYFARGARIVRVRVTQYKPRKRHAP